MRCQVYATGAMRRRREIIITPQMAWVVIKFMLAASLPFILAYIAYLSGEQ